MTVPYHGDHSTACEIDIYAETRTVTVPSSGLSPGRRRRYWSRATGASRWKPVGCSRRLRTSGRATPQTSRT